MTQRKQNASTKPGATPAQVAKADRSATVHPRIALDEEQTGKNLARQTRQSEAAIWGECISLGLLVLLIKTGPDEQGMYAAGRWTAKELAQVIRRRFLSELIDFQFEHGEMPSFLREYLQTLKGLAEQRSARAPGPLSYAEDAVTAEDALVFSTLNDPEGVANSLGGVGFGLLGLNHAD